MKGFNNMNDNNKNHAVISNKDLVVWYLKHGKKPIDIFVHDKSNSMMFVFDKTDTAELYTKYLDYIHR